MAYRILNEDRKSQSAEMCNPAFLDLLADMVKKSTELEGAFAKYMLALTATPADELPAIHPNAEPAEVALAHLSRRMKAVVEMVEGLRMALHVATGCPRTHLEPLNDDGTCPESDHEI